MIHWPLLGFGAMRLPSDEALCKRMFSYYLDGGFNYFDTAYAYSGSEEMLKKALVSQHPRDRFTLADKLPPWEINTPKDCDRLLNESLKRCGVDYFDFYLLHSMDAGKEEKIASVNGYEWAFKQKEKGLCRHVGFSFHGTADLLERMLTEHPDLDFVMLQLNYLDVLRGHAAQLHEIVLKHKKPLIVMEPVRGGMLAKLPPEAEAKMKAFNPNRSPAAWALRYAASLEGVCTVLSGMSNFEQVTDNVATMQQFTPMTAEEYAVLEEVLEELSKVATIPCTACKYCVEDCPQQINIPVCFSLYNDSKRGAAQWNMRMQYSTQTGNKAKDCIACGACLSHCPQGIDIPSQLAVVAKAFGA